MASTNQRMYSTKNVDMLITSATILESAIANKDFLIAKRSAWADPFFDKLKDRIDTAIQNLLGIDNAKDLRSATNAIRNIQAKAIDDLAEVKIQIMEDFKSDKPRQSEILNILGFTTFYKDVHKKDQEALINLLFRFKTNLTPQLRDEIINKGTENILLDNVINHANSLKDADISQETFKGLRKEITVATRNEFNDIYNQVISISKIASKFFKEEPVKKDHFSFYKVSRKLNTFEKTVETESTETELTE